MTRNKHEACSDVSETVGADFDWTNSGTEDCEITHCDPPLMLNRYHVPAGGTVHAKVSPTARPGTYEYECRCGRSETNPKIIIN